MNHFLTVSSMTFLSIKNSINFLVNWSMNWKISSTIKRIMICTNFNRWIEEDSDRFRENLFDLDWWIGSDYITCYWTDQVGVFHRWNDLIFLFQTRQFLYMDFKDWLAQATDIRLSEKIDMTSSKYEYTGKIFDKPFLFIDSSSLKIIFCVMMMIYREQWKVVVLLLFIILFQKIGRKLMVEHWIYSKRMVTRSLMIFFCVWFQLLDENQPCRIVKSLLPKRNRLTFFEVTDKSYHQVICSDILICHFRCWMIR